MKTVKILASVGVLVLLMLSVGCSLSTSEAELTINNTWSDSDGAYVDGDFKVIEGNSSRTWSFEWDGLDDKDVDVELYDTETSSSPFISTTVTLSNGDDKSYSY